MALQDEQAQPLITIKRKTVKADPVLIDPGDTAAQSQRRQKTSNLAIATLPIWASNYINLWFTAATAALANAPQPEDTKARRNWWIALAGNLAWAATSLVDPQMAFLIRVMSFAGASVGSGALAADAAPSGEGVVVHQLARARDELIHKALPTVEGVAVECGFEMVDDIEEQKQRLWSRIISEAPYENSDAIVGNMESRIAIGLKQFSEQWEAWKSGDEGATPEKLGAAIKRRTWLETFVSKPEDTLVLMEELRERWKAEHPFKPNLTF
jgi:hypothetical protein